MRQGDWPGCSLRIMEAKTSTVAARVYKLPARSRGARSIFLRRFEQRDHQRVHRGFDSMLPPEPHDHAITRIDLHRPPGAAVGDHGVLGIWWRTPCAGNDLV